MTENNIEENNQEDKEKGQEKESPFEQGVVTNVKPFGAFIKLDDGRDGLVHISEIANEFVKDINDFVKFGDTIVVKVLGVNKKNNKLDLSLKQTLGQDVKPVIRSKPVKKAVSHDAVDSFENRITTFMKRSDEKQIDIRRNLKNKQGIGKKRK